MSKSRFGRNLFGENSERAEGRVTKAVNDEDGKPMKEG
jgi:hypothetical protein